MHVFQSIVGALLTVSLGAAGLYFTVRTGFFVLRRPSLLWKMPKKATGKKQGGISGLGALCVSLGGTIGAGNTVGVAAAILFGGAGAVFWMWVAAALGMALKYAEVYLARRYRDGKTGKGGAMFLLRALGKPRLGSLFSLATVLVSFGMGNLAQSGAAADCLFSACGIAKPVSAAVIALVCFFIFRGGLKRLGAFSLVFLPAGGGVFLFLTLAVLIKNAAFLPGAVRAVFTEAFSVKSAAGGFFASAFARGLFSGFSRGIFSNEAGLGSAPLVHAAADTSPREAGLRGAGEVFLDTHLVCTLSALCILSSPACRAGGLSPGALCTAVFSDALGKPGAVCFALSLYGFAAASILAWGYYGACGVRFLSRKKVFLLLYYAVFFALIFCGALTEAGGVLAFSDAANAAMALPNLYALFRLRREVPVPMEPEI